MRQSSIIWFLILVISVSCGSQEMDQGLIDMTGSRDYKSTKNRSGKLNLEEEQTQKDKQPEINDETIDIEKKIIKTGNVRFEVDDYKKAKIRIDSIVKKWNGYISNENEYKSEVRINNTIIIRVPKENFDLLLKDVLKGAKYVDSKEISVSDVTEEYIDLYTRLKNKKKVESQYVELLNKAKSVEDILKVQEHLRKIREEIESAEGRLKYLDNKVSFSTLTLNIYQDFESQSGFGRRLVDGFAHGWDGLLSFFVGLAVIWPVLLFLVITIWIIIRVTNKNRKKKSNKTKN